MSQNIGNTTQIHENFYFTGTLNDTEQLLVIRHGEDTLVLAGCSHPGVEKILTAAKKTGKPTVLFGGPHRFDNFELLDDLRLICPTHCTQHITCINSGYSEKSVMGGIGQMISI